jgi:hypothetical protein
MSERLTGDYKMYLRDLIKANRRQGKLEVARVVTSILSDLIRGKHYVAIGQPILVYKKIRKGREIVEEEVTDRK